MELYWGLMAMSSGNLTEQVCLPLGFKAAGIRAGIKKSSSSKDLALIVSEVMAVAAGTFTTNQIKAAPVKLCREHLRRGFGQAIIINSGIANACTGEQGLADAERTASLLATFLGIQPESVFVCSTGTIGPNLPMDLIESGVEKIVGFLSETGGREAVEAIMTTDTRPKYISVPITIDGKKVLITGLAKGAGMIEPNMATMLGFILTDAAVERNDLQLALSRAVAKSFNRISVDGDKSTNDTVLCLANGCAGNKVLSADHPQWADFCGAIESVALDLAMKIVSDGEGAQRQVTVLVKGAQSDDDADRAARAVANSFLVKTSWAGRRLNWGRVMDALGYSPALVREELVDIDYDEMPIVRGGKAATQLQNHIHALMERSKFTIKIDLHLGAGEAVVYTCDCTEEYVRINLV